MPETPTPANVDNPQDGSPSWDEVSQREENAEIRMAAVPVHVDGPVETHELPPRTSVCRTLALAPFAANPDPVELISKDLRRKRAVIIPIGGDIWVGLSSTDCRVNAGATIANGGRLVSGQQTVLFGSSRLFCSAVAAAVTVTVITESWAD